MEGAIGIRLFRDRLTRYVARVRRGHRVVVTDRGKPVAVLVPYRAGKTTTTREARLAALFASGHVTRGERPFKKQIVPVKGRGELASEVLVKDRR
jgi:prevent-host-death family protein